MSGFSKLDLVRLHHAVTRGMNGRFEREHIELAVSWAELTRHYAELLDLVLMGYLDIAGVDEDGMPLFIATPLGLAEKPRELERMRV